jgi:hypothetical protein
MNRSSARRTSLSLRGPTCLLAQKVHHSMGKDARKLLVVVSLDGYFHQATLNVSRAEELMTGLYDGLGRPRSVPLGRGEVMRPAGHADTAVQQDGEVRPEPPAAKFLLGAHSPAPFISSSA